MVADWLGRRNAMSIECAIFTVGVVIQLASISAWYQFAIGRFIAGLGVGALSAAVPLYQAETGEYFLFRFTLKCDADCHVCPVVVQLQRRSEVH